MLNRLGVLLIIWSLSMNSCQLGKNSFLLSDASTPFQTWNDFESDHSHYAYLRHLSIFTMIDFNFNHFKRLVDFGFLPNLAEFWDKSNSSPYHAEFLFSHKKEFVNVELDSFKHQTVSSLNQIENWEDVHYDVIPLSLEETRNRREGSHFCIVDYLNLADLLKSSIVHPTIQSRSIQNEICLTVTPESLTQSYELQDADIPYLYAELVLDQYLQTMLRNEKLKKRPGDILLMLLPVTFYAEPLIVSKNSFSLDFITQKSQFARKFDRFAFKIAVKDLDQKGLTFAKMSRFKHEGRSLWKSIHQAFESGMIVFPYFGNKDDQIKEWVVSSGQVQRSKIRLNQSYERLFEYKRLSPRAPIAMKQERRLKDRALTTEEWLKESFRQSNQSINSIPTFGNMMAHQDSHEVLYYFRKKDLPSRSLFAISTLNSMTKNALPFSLKKLNLPPTQKTLKRLVESVAIHKKPDPKIGLKSRN